MMMIGSPSPSSRFYVHENHSFNVRITTKVKGFCNSLKVMYLCINEESVNMIHVCHISKSTLNKIYNNGQPQLHLSHESHVFPNVK